MLNLPDLLNIFKFWLTFFVIGLIFIPLTINVFKDFKDKGYIFAKTIGVIFISYSIFVIASFKFLNFSLTSILIILLLYFILNVFIFKKFKLKEVIRKNLRIIIIEELIFLITLIFWSYVRGNMPNIHGLEKFMDFGFVNAILRADYFPALDMWYSGLTINYYYFGHLITAVLIKISSVTPSIGYNLMLAALFALTFTSVLSLVINIFDIKKLSLKSSVSGIIAASLVTLSGNLTAIYAFFKAYVPAENPVQFWQLPLLPLSFPNGFWYPNATRFIQFTIHEFPLYSFVVSDLHGHVLDIPIVLLSIALIFVILLENKIRKLYVVFISFLLAVMYMTNAWDGIIYALLSIFIFTLLSFYKRFALKDFIFSIIILGLGFIIFSFPFSSSFKPFVSGIGFICAPDFLTSIGKIGPFLFEADHCQRSPLWQLSILYGFFYFFVISFIVFLRFRKDYKPTKSDVFVTFLIIISTLLIIIPEFIYVKDIYPAHYRANTMFKLTYEAFIMLSIASGYIIVKILSSLNSKKFLVLLFIPTLILMYLVFSYPVFAINSYYDNLQKYKGLDGTTYMKDDSKFDYELINWININIKGQPVIIEAVGDSYTDYARISANTGIPTVLGWPVHEWLWRGTYEVARPRVEDVKLFYTTDSLQKAKDIIKKYDVSFVVVSILEKQKYPNLNENNIKKLGDVIYKDKNAKLYKINL